MLSYNNLIKLCNIIVEKFFIEVKNYSKMMISGYINIVKYNTIGIR